MLFVLVAISLAGSALVPPLARWAQATMPPARAVVITTAASLAAAFGMGIALSALAIAALATWGPIARDGGISTTVLRTLAPIPAWLGVTAAVAVVALLVRSAVRTLVMAVSLYHSARLCRDLPGTDQVTFIDGDDIVTLAGLHGRILVGQTLFDRLGHCDRRVVLAHERSHLRHRHHLYVQAVDLAAAANPLVAAARSSVRLGVERWADEDAAVSAAGSDRDLTARVLARVALQRTRLRSESGPNRRSWAGQALAMAALQVSTRVRALMQPPPPRRTARMVLIAAVAVVVLGAGVFGLARVSDLIEIAQNG